MQNILQRFHKDLVSYLLKRKLVIVSFKILESIYVPVFKISKTSLGLMGYPFMQSTAQITP